jgi:hypothetical protein
MMKKVLAMVLLSLLAHAITCVQPASAKSKTDRQAQYAEKVRAGIARLGVGRASTVEVRLQDKSKLAGYVSQANDSHFVITDAKTGASVPVAYGDVTKVKGHNLSTGAKIGIGIAIGFLATAAIIFLTR